MRKIIFSIALVVGILAFVACDKYVPGGTATQNVAGEWWVQFEAESSTGTWSDIYGIGHVVIDTYNTADNSPSEMWINDNGKTWNFKVKIPADPLHYKFGVTTDLKAPVFTAKDSVTNAITNYPIKVVVFNGQVFPGEGHSKSGVKTDSIQFYVTFEDDPGTIYRIAGVKRTGFPEDEY